MSARSSAAVESPVLPATGAETGEQTGERGSEPFYFDGVESPNGTIFPDVLLDRVMPHLSGAEFKVLAYIVRRTFGFKKESDSISLDQICNGITRRDGSILDEGTGLARKTAVAAIQGLEAKGVILCQRRSSREKGNLPTSFALRFKGQGGTTPGTNLPQGGSEKYPGGGEARHQPGHLAPPALGTALHSQPTVVQPTAPQGSPVPNVGTDDGEIGTAPRSVAAPAQRKPDAGESARDACWAAVLERLATQVGEVSYRTWLAPARLCALDAGGATITVPNILAQRWIERHLVGAIEAELAAVAGQPLPVRVLLAGAPTAVGSEPRPAAVAAPAPPRPATVAAPPLPARRPGEIIRRVRRPEKG